MRKLYIIAIFFLVGAACTKKDVGSPNFSVAANKESYTTADTVFFALSGTPWYLTFYSGEPYHKYENRLRVTADGIPTFQFGSTVTTGTQANTLRLLVSSDFNGTYDSANIYQATWSDITDKAKLATGSATVSSGVIDLTPFINEEHPVYIAFKYIGNAGSAQRNWTLKTLTLNNVLPDSTSYNLLDISESTAGFKSVAMKNTAVKWTVSTSQLNFKGGTTTTSPEAEGWVISKPLNLKKVVPDYGVPLKNMTTIMDAYYYIYTAPGSYTATFVASNASRYDSKDGVYEVPVTIQ
ncbi:MULTISPECIES: DUF5017 domain-containing protein [Niastella]|uniref:DUF5017 domain-containing protein n=1 Tax=Niastella soli TaxID=2821487 RepID=A0ABS3Z249_9BACT|nr:DUF5017 domain-containing protein [Niastella soli]MBO9204241.1 DUF5017 domain-containing protein [Niastella soli]